jgi:NADPH:quinone reductase-like Zn-dependent oxidoreductase
MSSWAAYKERARLRAGETVLVNGAAGRLAVQIAKHLGAAKVIATGRNLDALKSVAGLGADVTIRLLQDGTALENAFKEQFAAGVDVVIDYLWGPSAERLMIAGPRLEETPRRSGLFRSVRRALRTSPFRARRCARRRLR